MILTALLISLATTGGALAQQASTAGVGAPARDELLLKGPKGGGPPVFGRIGERWHKHYLAALAWSVLIAITLVLALLLQALVATALVASESAVPPAACRSTAGAALAHGDDVRARFLADSCAGAIGATPQSCSVPATEHAGEACIS